MPLPRLVLAFLIAIPVLSFAQSSPSARPAPGFSIDNLDKSLDPCADFYQYACGNWLKKSEIPADQSSWGSFNELHERNLEIEHGILDKAAGSTDRNPIDQKIGDLYGSCMDEKTVDSKGIMALKPELDRINAVQDKQGLIDEIAHLHRMGTNPLFNFYANSDMHNADQVIAYIDQGGLTLPDRDYYLKDTGKNKDIRQALASYMNEIFTLAARDQGGSAQESDPADTVLRIETELAKAQMDRTARRDPKNRDHKMTREEAVALGPNFYLDRYFQQVNAPAFKELNVTNPDFFKQINSVLESESLESLKTYVRWHLLHTAAPWLSEPYVDANFKFQQALTGQKEIQARWKRCVNLVDRELGEALGQRYVEVAFPPESKTRMLKMVRMLEASLDQDIQNLSWMSDEPRSRHRSNSRRLTTRSGIPRCGGTTARW